MNELFGLSMTVIAVACVILTLGIFAIVGYLALRNPVMFKNGLRNIPRRKSQTTLIVVGLMLSTVIITAAFSIGDTLTRSVTSEAYSTLGPVDELVTWDTKAHPAPEDKQRIPLSDVARWRQQLGDDVKAVIPFLAQEMPVVNTRTHLNEPAPRVVAAPTDALASLGGLKDTDGNAVQLSAGDVALDQELADKIHARTGDTVQLLYQGKPVELTVKAIVPNDVLGGAQGSSQREGAAVNFDFMAQLTGDTGTANFVAISNTGETRGGLGNSDEVTAKLDSALRGTTFKVDTTKQDNVDSAERFGNVFTTLFLVIGMFSIAAGILLIFLIFVMLAAERRPEMGMARAVGAKRRQIVESFLAEGMGYDLGSAIVGLGIGVGVAAAMTTFVRIAAGDRLGGVTLSFDVAARSLVTSFCLGIITTFIVVFLASWRASRINITSAIRDLPDSKPVNPETATVRGYLRGALNGFAAFGIVLISVFAAVHFTSIFPVFIVAAVCALPGIWLPMLRGHSFGAPAAARKEGERVPRWPFILGVVTLPIGIGAVILVSYSLALLLVRATRERPRRDLSASIMLAGIVIAPLGVYLAARQDRRSQVAWSAGFGCVGLVLGILLTQWSLDAKREWMFATGVSLVFFWAAATLRYFRIRERLSFTVTSLGLLVFWYLAASAQLDWLTGKLDAGPEMLFFSGVTMVIAGTFVIVYNADIVLPLLGRFGNRFGRVLPAVKTAVAYPLTSRFRTGITVAMIALIMFIVSMMAAFNSNFAKSFNNDDSKGGYDIRVQVNPNNPSDGLVGDLKAADAAGTSNIDTSKIEAVGENRIVSAPQVSIRDPKLASDAWKHYTLIGADTRFIDSNRVALQYRASGYATDEDVWQALKTGQDLAIIPSADALSGGGFGGGTIDDPIKIPSSYTGEGFTPFKLQVQGSDGRVSEVTVIGQFKNSSLAFWPGILLSKETVLNLYPGSKGQAFFVRLAPGTNAGTYADQIEASLVSVSADTTSQVIEDNQTINRVFLDVFEGFLALGLIVGIAALGVIAFRSVVERRQQIGVLRAIGYQRRMVELSFLFESGFIALSGIGLGLLLGLSLAWSLFTSGALGAAASDIHFTVPWLQVGAVTAFALIASLVMAWLPARAASKVPVAEALRYE